MRPIAFFLLVGAALGAGAQTRRLTPDDMPKVVRILDPQIAPDGRTIAIVVGRANLKEDRWETELELVDVATKKLTVMTHDRLGVGWVRWSPSGDRIAYLAQDANKKAQIFVLPMAGGDSVQVTHAKTSVALFAWRPDGLGFAYAANDEEPEKKDEAKFEDAFEVGNNDYLERSRAVPTHLWLVGADGGEAKRLTAGAWSLPHHFAPSGPPSQIWFTKDGTKLIFVKADSPISGDNDSSRLEVVDIATGALHALTGAAAPEDDPVLSPDGTKVAYSFPRDGKRRNLDSVYVAPVSGGAGKDAAYGLDRGVGGAAWLPDSETLLVTGNEGTKVGLWKQPIGGKAVRVDVGGLTPGALATGKDGAVAMTASDAGHAPELFYVAHVGDPPVQLTHLQSVTDGVALGKQETVKWKSDQFDVDGVLTYPPDYVAGGKLPLVLYIHGGPTSASLESFSMIPQIFAAHGWLVFEPNYRGSNNEGNAFATAIVEDSGAGPGRDVMAGVAALERRGIVDETKIAVGGWSYGGYMTSWLIGNYPTTWKVAVAGAPVTDIIDQYTLSDNNIERAAGYGPSPFLSEKNMKAYEAQSPITYAWRIKAPTLIMSDGGDWRVTTTQAYKLYHALKDNGVPVTFISYPVSGHSPADPIRSRDVFRRWTAWLSQYLNQ
jgi:dipeptidyl aminopeptidase/acylaminoacyl peptidase